MKLLPVLICMFFLSCNQGNKLTDRDELGRKIFDKLKAQDKDGVMSYLVTKAELEKVLRDDTSVRSLPEAQQKQMIASLYESQVKDVGSMVDYYVKGEYPEIDQLKEGIYQGSSFTERPERGVMISEIVTNFKSRVNSYKLITKAVKVDDYWKLISWVEIRKE